MQALILIKNFELNPKLQPWIFQPGWIDFSLPILFYVVDVIKHFSARNLENIDLPIFVGISSQNVGIHNMHKNAVL